MLDGLRDELDALGLTRFDIQLPGEDSAVAPLEGALRVRANGAGFVLETVDYGEAVRLATAESEPEIKEAVIDYVSRPLPPVRVISRHELDTIVGKVALHYFDLRDRAREAGQRGIVIDLPAELPIDRIGALDGMHTYPIDTPFEFRSLPPTALRPENDVHQFLTAADVRVAGVNYATLVRTPRGRHPLHPATAGDRPTRPGGLGAVAAHSDRRGAVARRGSIL